jgi:acetyl-CoA acyltransferase
MTSAVVVDVIRTPSAKGNRGGNLAAVHPAELLATVLRALVERTGIDPALVDDVIAGCVTQSGEQAYNIARIALLAAGFPESVPGVTIDRACGSSLQAAHFAAQGVLAGAYDVAIACGVESMSRSPMFSSGQGADTSSPLATRYPDGLVQQGISAELVAARWKLSREELDGFAARSHQLAAASAAAGWFDNEIVPVGSFTRDATIRPSTTVEGLSRLAPSFTCAEYASRFPEIAWSITAGNSSPLTDAASAALIMSEASAAELGLCPRARFHAFSVVGSDPLLMLTGPVLATTKVLARAGLGIDDIDAYEVNEAFAAVPLMWAREVDADPRRMNPRGGAIALGHAFGASGTRLLATLVNHLEASQGRFGLITMCEAQGMANATVLERL